jgi:hypothetical protein
MLNFWDTIINSSEWYQRIYIAVFNASYKDKEIVIKNKKNNNISKSKISI